MNDSQAPPPEGEFFSSEQEALFESLLIACDEALARGEKPAIDESLVPPQLQPRWRAALACVSLLARAQPRARPPAGAADEPKKTPLNAQIGRFDLLRELGRGGHGVVFLAVDPRLRRLVALKVPRPEVLMTPDLHRRFLREGRAASGLAHPNLVPIHEIGEDGPLCYIAAGYCEGPSLASWLKERPSPLDWREAASLVVQLADATAHAHARGVLHRDIKPANVLLAPADSGSPGATLLVGERVIPCLTDFGLARLIDDDASERTHTGTMLGTPPYMAPEQAAGRVEDIGPATDVYALGAVLYELLVGRPPFRGANDLETIRLVTDAHLVAPSALRAHFPRDLEAICLKTLAASPSDRYQTAAEFAADLLRFLEGQPTQARPLGPLGKLTRWTRRQPMAAAVVSLLLILAIAAPFVALRQTYLAKSASDARVEAQNSAARETDARKDAEQMAAQLKTAAQELRGHLYRAQMDLAHQAYREGNIDRVITLLEQCRPSPGDDDQRDFGWRHLWRRSHEYRRRIDAEAAACALSRNGRYLALTHLDGSRIDLYDLATGDRLRTVEERVFPLWLEFHPTSDVLAYYDDEENGVVLVDVLTGERRARLLGAAGLSGGFSPDGNRLATGANNDFVTVWDIERQLPLISWKWTDKSTTAVGYRIRLSSDGAFVIGDSQTVFTDPHIRIWDATTGELKNGLEGPWRGLRRPVALSPDARTAAYLTLTHVGMVDLQNGQETTFRVEDPHHAASVAYSPQGRLVVSYGDGTIRFFDPAGGQLADIVKGSGRRPPVFSADGRLFAAVSKEVLVWGSNDRRGYQRLQADEKEIRTAAFSESGVAATVGDKNQVKFWNAVNGEPLTSMPETHSTICSLAMTRDGKRVAVGDVDGGITIWDTENTRELAHWLWDVKYVKKLAFSPDGAVLVSGTRSTDNRDNIAFWNPATGELLKTLPGHPVILRTLRQEVHHYLEKQRGEITALAFSPDGKTLATGAEWRVRLWDLASGEMIRELAEHGGHITGGIAFSPDGKLLASGGSDNVVKLWEVGTGKLLETLTESGLITGVAFSPDGRLLAISTFRGVRLWHVPTRDLCGTLDQGESYVRPLTFTADGAHLMGASSDGALHLWHADGDDSQPATKPLATKATGP
jgi:eukaryotic-like serine/threonine-protein kinase